jgi:hypothetical protein
VISANKSIALLLAGGLLLAGTAVAGPFGAYYTKINSGEPFEQLSRTGAYADIVVDLPDLGRAFVFWRASSYLPYWEVDGREVDGISARLEEVGKLGVDHISS